MINTSYKSVMYIGSLLVFSGIYIHLRSNYGGFQQSSLRAFVRTFHDIMITTVATSLVPRSIPLEG